MTFPVRTCTVCGRRGVHGTARCELHPYPPRESEASRNLRHPYRAEYSSPEYRHNRPLALARAAGRCEACGGPLGESPEVDHVLPVRDGGTSALSNLRALCRSCVKVKNRDDKRRRRR